MTDRLSCCPAPIAAYPLTRPDPRPNSSPSTVESSVISDSEGVVRPSKPRVESEGSADQDRTKCELFDATNLSLPGYVAYMSLSENLERRWASTAGRMYLGQCKEDEWCGHEIMKYRYHNPNNNG